ncbi:YceI family protein [Altererythrobacter aquiaggeris]|uniref:YceI family protein n=1 Tax=Aestuarierythrobacter aquiaggeris TaxID=1898396 RepID=UPI003018DCF8
MKRLLALLLALPLLGAAPDTLDYAVDRAQSSVAAKVAFLGLASKTASFPSMSGTVRIAPERPQDMAINITIDATRLTAPDAVTLGRLRGEKFFWVEKYPAIKFAGRSMTILGPKRGKVDGSLTARGVTRPVALDVVFDRPVSALTDGRPVTITANTRIDRRDFGMTSYSLIVGRKVDIAIKARMNPGK